MTVSPAVHCQANGYRPAYPWPTFHLFPLLVRLLPRWFA